MIFLRFVLLALCVAHAAGSFAAAQIQSGFKLWRDGTGLVPPNRVEGYELDLEVGLQRVWARYPTLTGDVDCLFVFTAEAGSHYEIVDMSHAYPLTLFQTLRVNGLWTRRLDPVLPQRCSD